ncbi:type II toxin-antitoxin system VapC family toxin [Archaeoglobus veneficus]|uniref:PilT protein domain protein n=1 Tax=Archaeoglobus veneficus (strain DSM 11195 / SNP6) TaxID=693661 RepID=F2KND4_ARCVS|nr:PIN domain-containing protein [Archaeoglobus veneficus]AEA47336.1 PilT protein domain protein [Archaeoglobus veneficus SNP6]
MRFLDANIFIYAYYKPKKELNEKARWMKEESKKILKRVSNGEEVVTTIVHLSEVNNFLKKSMDTVSLQNFFLDLYSLENVKIIDVSANDYLAAIVMMAETGLDANDCLALKVMRDMEITEIYTFDRAFERFVIRLP